ncbi:MAG: hypothetical protein LBM13_04760 [Candidatus Ancillula sp.]|nr:hypothetical protein [Candidatus Ancillula sp.]
MKLLEAGIKVSIHSDDHSYFGVYIDDNYKFLKKQGVSSDAISLLKHNSLMSCWY